MIPSTSLITTGDGLCHCSTITVNASDAHPLAGSLGFHRSYTERLKLPKREIWTTSPVSKKQYGVPSKYLSIPAPYGVYKLNFMKHRPRSPGPFSVPRRSERENACVFKRDDLPAALYKFKLQHSGLNTRASPLFYSLTFPFFRSAGHFILSLLL